MQFETNTEEELYHIHALSEVLEALLTQTQENLEAVPSIFNAKSVPSISIKDYLTRLKQRSKCSSSALILALVYIDKYARAKSLPLTFLNIHRLYLCGLLLASKFIDDVYFDNRVYAVAGGVELSELNAMELQVFQSLGFNVMFDHSQFQQYQNLALEFQ